MTPTPSSVRETRQKILERVSVIRPRIAPLLTNQLGVVVAEDIISDVDMPGEAMSMMDGFAINSFCGQNARVFPIAGRSTAGNRVEKLIPDCCQQIMTGAPLPEGANCVVPFEQTKQVAGGIEISPDSAKPNKFIREKGFEFCKGQVLVKAGTVLGPVEYGLMALAGKTAVLQHEAPSVAVISTGNEIIEPGMKPNSTQVRNSNGPMLMAQSCRFGAMPRFLGIAPDEVVALRSMIHEGATYDCMIISGGASKGEADLVRHALSLEGYNFIIDGVLMRPGKPFICAMNGNGKLAFCLPGNPVSAFVCAELFVGAAIKKMRSVNVDTDFPLKKGKMLNEFAWNGDRPFIAPMKHNGQGDLQGMGMKVSADLLSISGVNALAFLDAAGNLVAGESVDYLSID